MRLVRAAVPDERREDVTAALDDIGVDRFVSAGVGGSENESLVEIPVADSGVGDVTEALAEAGVELDRYTIVHDVEWASTPRSAGLRKEYADRYDRPTHRELRGLADQLEWDVSAFAIMMVLSGVIAAIGILLESPVIVVGSAVVAPIINPMLISDIGTIVGERWMVRDSIRLQALGLVVAFVSALAVGLGAEALSLAPETLEVPALEMVQTRLAPAALALLVGVVAGVASTVSLTAESSLLNLVGVMVAAALIPAVAATGVALAWGYPLIALGSAVLVVATVIAIDLAGLATFLALGYRPSDRRLSLHSGRTVLLVATIVLVLGVIVVGAAAASAGQIAFEQDVNAAVDDVVTQEEYEGVSTLGVRSQYAGFSPFTAPETVTVEMTRPDGQEHPDLAAEISERITTATDREVSVQVEFVVRQESG